MLYRDRFQSELKVRTNNARSHQTHSKGHKSRDLALSLCNFYEDREILRANPKAMAAKGSEQRHLFLLYQYVVLGVIVYGLGLTTMAQTNTDWASQQWHRQIRTWPHNNSTDKYVLGLTTMAQTNTDLASQQWHRQIRTWPHNNGTDKYGLGLTTMAQTNTDLASQQWHRQIRTWPHNNGTDKYGLGLTTMAQTNTD